MNRTNAAAAMLAASLLYAPGAQVTDLAPLVAAHIDFVNGGIGKEEADALRAQARSFPLEVTFTRRADGSDAFIADVRIRIVAASGHAVIDRTAGPILLARLPDGAYTIIAEYQGQTQTRLVTIADGRHERVSLVWS